MCQVGHLFHIGYVSFYCLYLGALRELGSVTYDSRHVVAALYQFVEDGRSNESRRSD